MLSCPFFGGPFSTTPTTTSANSAFTVTYEFHRSRTFIKQALASLSSSSSSSSSSIHYDSLRVLEWDKLCDSVASFATTSLGREVAKARLWSLNQTYEQSLQLLGETDAAVEMHKHGGCRLDFSHIDSAMVKSAIRCAHRSIPVNGNEAMAIAALLQYADDLQVNLKAAIREDAEWYSRFLPLSELIMGFVPNRSLVKLIDQVIDESGSVKDSASSTLKQSREQVRMIERKMNQLMERLIRNERNDSPVLEVSNIDGRWCLKVDSSQSTSISGLLLSSGSGSGSIIEPFSAVPLNDDLQRARASVAKAEADVLLMLTEKMQTGLDGIEKLLDDMVQLDVINARATYGLSFGGTCPHLFFQEVEGSYTSHSFLAGKNNSNPLFPNKSEWILYMPKAYHPLLLQMHKEKVRMAKKEKVGKTPQGKSLAGNGEISGSLSETDKVSILEETHPVPVDIFIPQKTRALIITGPNTGGKTICLKTLGLAALMAKSGVYVLASESVRIPWFDHVYADIGHEQSLSQSLSTFSGHLKQISEILSNSTSRSLVLLDEVGAGTNPLEGAALGMSLLECFAGNHALLTIATTHHGELKTLKYSNDAFENACMEFDEVNLNPTYRLLQGIPGRSNAISIAGRLGLPSGIVDNAREIYGSASAEIDEIIIDMEKLKRQYQELVDEGHVHLTQSRILYGRLLESRKKIMEHITDQRLRKIQDISKAAAIARSALHRKVRQLQASARQKLQENTPATKHDKLVHKTENRSDIILMRNCELSSKNDGEPPRADESASSVRSTKKLRSEKSGVPKVGDLVHIPSLGKSVRVLKVDSFKEEVVVQAGMMKMKFKLADL